MTDKERRAAGRCCTEDEGRIRHVTGWKKGEKKLNFAGSRLTKRVLKMPSMIAILTYNVVQLLKCSYTHTLVAETPDNPTSRENNWTSLNNLLLADLTLLNLTLPYLIMP